MSPILIDVQISYAAANPTSPRQVVRDLLAENATALISTQPTKVNQANHIPPNGSCKLGITQ